MIRMRLKTIRLRRIRKLHKAKIMAEEIKNIPIEKIFKASLAHLHTSQPVLRCFWLANFVILGAFALIPGGLSNPLSIVWLLCYYVYWCGFFRFYFKKKPYFLTIDIFGSIVPSTKIFFITVLAAFLLIILPYLPLFMGFNEKYLLFFEKYMQALQNAEANIINQIILSAVLLIISPLIICRPYFAWISSLQGLNGSMRKAFHKTEGNYWRFVWIMIVLNLPSLAIYEMDKYLGCHGWLSVGFYSIFFIYLNLVFAKLYDFFYNEQDFA